MICFKVKKNGKRLCTAGISNKCVLSAIVTYVDVVDPGPKPRRTLDVSVGGLDCETNEHMNWARADLKAGDRIEISVDETATVDRSTAIRKVMTPKEMMKDALARIRVRRKALLGELKNIDLNERAYQKELNAGKKPLRTPTRPGKKKRK